MTSYTQTLYQLFLGDQQTSAPYHFQRGYTITSITAYIWPNGGAWSFGSLGYHATNTPTAITQYTVSKGDVIFDVFGNYYQIKNIMDWPIGDQLQFKTLELEKLKVFPFLAGFFGFEDDEHGLIGYGFEDGFERGYWAL